MRVGIIGAQGWLGAILGQRLLDQGIVAPQDLMVMTRGGPGADYAGRAAVRWAENAAALVAGVDIIVAAVRPHDWDAVRLVAPDRLLISFMAGVGLAQLAGTGARVVRAMPNAAAAIGASYTPWFGGPDISADDADHVTRLLAAIGQSERLQDETHLDLMAAVSGSGAAYPALMAQALASYLTAAGVAADIADRAALAVMRDASQLLGTGDGAPDQLLRTYRDYGGMTGAGLQAAELAGFSLAVHQALDAALRAGQGLAAKKT